MSFFTFLLMASYSAFGKEVFVSRVTAELMMPKSSAKVAKMMKEVA